MTDDLERAMESIEGPNIVAHAKRLCRPKFAGREAGSAGARLAATYIAQQFSKAGLVPAGTAGTYFQTFKIRGGYSIQSTLRVETETGQTTLERKGNYMPIHLPVGTGRISADLALAGYGIASQALGFDDYAGLDVNRKAVLVFGGVPWSAETHVWLRRVEKEALYSMAYKAQCAASHGASLLLVVDDPQTWVGVLGAKKEELRLPNMQFPLKSPIPVVHISAETAAILSGISEEDLRKMALEMRESRKPDSRLTRTRIHYEAAIGGTARVGRNVIGILPGSDRTLRHEAIVIGAHYDHLGEGPEGTFFGANDNAAGVGAVIELARAVHGLRERPRRTMVFVAFGAEEIGKLGSYHYVERPPVPVKQTVLMINFDMIGHNDENSINAVATRSSDDLHRIHQEVNQYVKLNLDHPLNMRIGRSDHSAFYEEDIPVMYLFGGFHPEYNTPQDTPDLLKPMKLQKVARLAFLTACQVSEQKARIRFSD
jgi:Zn-dependent M28 family amino/carboxypeptidase